ncbi:MULTISPECIES: DUF397 domain-containing protein [Streptomyces]|uniref:DUF397 domain-containing protein n=1 Tax=Streptomyces cheonanensis TaxID=312720 RepID=A0ABP5GFA3_9ACTN|nr:MULTISPECIES: DUF397 domain-containing protein [Streptomyces]QKV68338.1 DUF397 domain-containing protein [Streptomyces harbinensis]
MGDGGFSDAVWHRSSYSDNNGGQCVEVALVRGLAGLRDSKVSGGPVLVVGSGAWGAFVRAAIRREWEGGS